MAPGLSGRFPGLPIVAATAFGFVGFLTFLGYIYDKYYKIEYKDKQNGKTSQGKSTPKETQRDSTIETPQGELTTSQIEHLINVIGTVDNETLENLLISLSNSCAFTQNQVKIITTPSKQHYPYKVDASNLNNGQLFL